MGPTSPQGNGLFLGLIVTVTMAGCSTAAGNAGSTSGSRPSPSASSCQVALPPPRMLPAMTYDQGSRTVLLFSGVRGDGTAPLNDTWALDRCGWHPLTPLHAPPGRSAAAMAFDQHSGKVILFGGGSANTDPSRHDTWSWNGHDWSEEHPGANPPQLIDVTMDYDRTNGNLLLFGFGGPSLQTPMTWTWDGTNWNEKHPLHAPTFRDGAGLAFGARSGIVLFGGFNGEGDSQGFNDTWVWDGSDWQPRHPAHTPASGPVYMVHEDARQDVLVLASNGTWIWNGTDWMQRASAASSPPFRAFAAMAYDATGARVVFFGGKDPSTNQPTGETWTWDGTGWTRASVQP